MDISPQAEARLVEAARREGIDPATLIDKLVFDYLPQLDAVALSGNTSKKTAGQIIREIGFAEGGPSDLSTNPKYMKGFGEARHTKP